MASRPITVFRQDNRWNVDYGDGTVKPYQARDEALVAANTVAWHEGRDVDNLTTSGAEAD